MKVLMKKVLISIVCIFAVTNICYGDGFYGTVYDNNTELPIESAIVKMSMNGSDSYVEKLTDENGNFVFLPNELPWKAYQDNTLRFTANKEDYKEYKYGLDYYDEYYDYNHVGYGPMFMTLNKKGIKHANNSFIIIRISTDLLSDTCPSKIELMGEKTTYYDKVTGDDACQEKFKFYFLPPDIYHLTIKFTNNDIRRKTIKLKKNMTKNKVIY